MKVVIFVSLAFSATLLGLLIHDWIAVYAGVIPAPTLLQIVLAHVIIYAMTLVAGALSTR